MRLRLQTHAPAETYMTRRSDLELRVQTLEQMLEITMTTLLKIASPEQKQT